MSGRPIIGTRYEFKSQYEKARLGEGATVTDVQDVYPTKAHNGPAFTTWVSAKTDDGVTIQRTQGQWNRQTRLPKGGAK